MLTVEKKKCLRKLSNSRRHHGHFVGWPGAGCPIDNSRIDHNRWYDPSVGKWPSDDPLGLAAGANPYSYCGDAPTDGIDPSGLWDISGHFWTTYLVAVSTGMTAAQAYELAYYSQLPDQVFSLDAYEQGKRNFIGLADKQWTQEIFNWLHSLHGGGPAAVAARRKCLRSLLTAPGSGLMPWEKGIIIHALGDAYAHTYTKDGQTYAYGYPWGHALASHVPDEIGQNFSEYEAYIRALYNDLGGSLTSGAPADPTGVFNRLLVQALLFHRGGVGPYPGLAAEATALQTLATGTTMPAGFAYTRPFVPGAGNLDPTMATPTLAQFARLIDKIKAACGCTTRTAIPQVLGAGTALQIQDRNQQILDQSAGLAPLPQN